MGRLRIIFAGSGEFGAPTLRRIVSAHDVVLVVTQPDRPAGRGRHPAATAIAKLTDELSLPLLKSENINREELPAADLMVVVAFGQKVAHEVVNRPRLGSVNLHASLLPKYRGASPVNWAIIRGEPVTGNSVIRLADRMDAGAVLGQSRLEIGELETAGELHDRLAIDGAELMARAIDELADGRALEREQDELQATLAPKLNRKDATVDFTAPAREVANRIRGLYPWPGCRVRVLASDGKEFGRLILARARAIQSQSPGAAGTILDDGSIATAAGAVEILDCQPEGGKLMSMSAYRNGHHWEPGMGVAPAG